MLRRACVVLLMVLASAMALASPAMAQGEVTCDDFALNDEGQAKAQSVLNLDPSDPFDLDSDGDSVACDVLPDEGPEGTDDTEYGYGDTVIPVSCADFALDEEGQAKAQTIYDLDPSDPYGLDGDPDGVACDIVPDDPPADTADSDGTADDPETDATETGDTADDAEMDTTESEDTGTTDDDGSASDASETITLPNTGTGTTAPAGSQMGNASIALAVLLLLGGGYVATRARMR